MTTTSTRHEIARDEGRRWAEATLARVGVDTKELRHRAECHYERIETFISEGASNYYRENGYDEREAAELFDLVKKFLAVAAAWQSMNVPAPLPLAGRVLTCGWYGFIIQTGDYAAAASRMQAFIQHATGHGQSGDAALTRAVVTDVFGSQGMALWD